MVEKQEFTSAEFPEGGNTIIPKEPLDSRQRHGRQKGRNLESDKKEEITSTDFPEGGNTISTKETPASQRWNDLPCIHLFKNFK